jgi:hypothetical protein
VHGAKTKRQTGKVGQKEMAVLSDGGNVIIKVDE